MKSLINRVETYYYGAHFLEMKLDLSEDVTEMLEEDQPEEAQEDAEDLPREATTKSLYDRVYTSQSEEFDMRPMKGGKTCLGRILEIYPWKEHGLLEVRCLIFF